MSKEAMERHLASSPWLEAAYASLYPSLNVSSTCNPVLFSCVGRPTWRAAKRAEPMAMLEAAGTPEVNGAWNGLQGPLHLTQWQAGQCHSAGGPVPSLTWCTTPSQHCTCDRRGHPLHAMRQAPCMFCSPDTDTQTVMIILCPGAIRQILGLVIAPYQYRNAFTCCPQTQQEGGLHLPGFFDSIPGIRRAARGGTDL